MKRKILLAVLSVLIVPILAMAVYATTYWEVGTHKATTSQEEWAQFSIDIYSVPLHAYGGDYHTPEDFLLQVGDPNWYVMKLEARDWIELRVPTDIVDHGLYKLVIVMATYNANTETWVHSTTNCALTIASDVSNGQNVYYANDPLPPAPPGSGKTWEGNELSFLPRDFGQVYFGSDAFSYHTIKFWHWGSGDIHMYLDELILIPA
jgi:hypothetical protein